MDSVVIIGGGQGGLFTGAILAKEGLTVTVLEKNSTAGGGLQSFRRYGETFDTGMHVIGGMEPGGNIWRICRYLGILDDIDIRAVDGDCADRLYFAEDHIWYTIANGRQRFVDTLARQFPGSRDDLQRYVDAVYAISDDTDLFHLRPSEGFFQTHSDDYLMAADAFIAKYIHDEKLRAVLAYMNPLYGGRGGKTPAFVHAIINTLYINGAQRFVGGSQRFADTLVRFIEAHGGRVLLRHEVTAIDVADRQVQRVVTTGDEAFTADHYIAAIHPCAMLRLTGDHAFTAAYRNRLDSIPNAFSAFSLYIKMRPATMPYINHSEYYMTRYRDIWRFADTDRPWPLGFLMMTPPEPEQGPWARMVLVTAPMRFDMVRQWENTTTGHRGADYEAWKARCADALVTMMEEMHPGFREGIEAMNTASPLTIRDFYHVKDGTIAGFAKDVTNMALSQIPVATKVHNLLLTGQCVQLHGFCGVPLTAITTAEAILGHNYILNKIAQCQ